MYNYTGLDTLLELIVQFGSTVVIQWVRAFVLAALYIDITGQHMAVHIITRG